MDSSLTNMAIDIKSLLDEVTLPLIVSRSHSQLCRINNMTKEASVNDRNIVLDRK